MDSLRLTETYALLNIDYRKQTLVCVLLATPSLLWAADSGSAGELAWGRMVIDLFGGLALFLP